MFSIITVVYNDVSHIIHTMQSVIQQSYKNVEYLLVDGGSNDGTKEAILDYLHANTLITLEEKSDSKLYIEATHSTFSTFTFKFLSQKDKGIYDAMNKGIKLASKEWIQFLNSGDYLHHHDVLKEISQQPITHQSVIYGDLNIHYLDQNIHILKKTSRDLKQLYALFYHFGHPNCFVKTKIYQHYLFDLQYQLAADYDFIYRLYQLNYSFFFTDIIIATFTSGGSSDKRGFESLKEALYIALKYNKKHPLIIGKILLFYLTALGKKIAKLYLPHSLSKALLALKSKS